MSCKGYFVFHALEVKVELGQLDVKGCVELRVAMGAPEETAMNSPQKNPTSLRFTLNSCQNEAKMFELTSKYGGRKHRSICVGEQAQIVQNREQMRSIRTQAEP